jgi:lipoate-protein ligase A
MTNAVRVLISSSTDPHINLAMEDHIFRTLPEHGHALMIWRNRPVVVIGRYQNPWLECNIPLMDAQGVALARRQSGGGTVYHDYGNINFTWFSPAADYQRERNVAVVMAALRRLGFAVEMNARKDLILEDKKISGSAYKQTRERCFHHATLLVSADLDKLQHYLRSPVTAVHARGTQSVRSRVTRLIDHNPVTIPAVIQAVTEEFFRLWQVEGMAEELDWPDVLQEQETDPVGGTNASVRAAQEYYQRQCSWQWQYGATPPFTLAYRTATITIDGGHITAVVPGDTAAGNDYEAVLQTPWGRVGPEHAIALLPSGDPLRRDFEIHLTGNPTAIESTAKESKEI